MDVVGFALALVGFVAAAGVWLHSMKRAEREQQRRSELETDLERTQARSKELEVEANESAARVAVLEKDLAEAIARRDEKAMAVAMWELELERSHRQWRDVVVPRDAGRSTLDANIGQQLAFALAQEVDRLREEVGVSIRFDGGLDLVFEAETALGMLRIGEELLALAAKQADDVHVSLDQVDSDTPLLTLTLACGGWTKDDLEEEGELTATIARMATRLDGAIEWRSEEVGEGDESEAGGERDVKTVVVSLPVESTGTPAVS